MASPDRLALLRELFGILFGLRFLLIALIWPMSTADLAVLQAQWPILLLMLALCVLAAKLSFFQISVSPDGSYDYSGSGLEIVIVYSVMFLFGPTAVQEAIQTAANRFSSDGGPLTTKPCSSSNAN